MDGAAGGEAAGGDPAEHGGVGGMGVDADVDACTAAEGEGGVGYAFGAGCGCYAVDCAVGGVVGPAAVDGGVGGLVADGECEYSGDFAIGLHHVAAAGLDVRLYDLLRGVAADPLGGVAAGAHPSAGVGVDGHHGGQVGRRGAAHAQSAQKGADGPDVALAGGAADTVNLGHFCGVGVGAAYGQGGLGRYDVGVAEGFLRGEVVELRVVHDVAAPHGVGYGRGIGHEQAEEPPRGGRLAEIAGLGEHHHVAGEAALLKIGERDGVADAAVEHAPAVVDAHGPREHRHGGRCAQPFERVAVHAVHLIVDGGACGHVGAHEVELHGIALEGVYVEDVELEGKGVVGEFGAHEVAGGEQRAQAHVARVAAVAEVVAQHTAGLTRLVVAAEA